MPISNIRFADGIFYCEESGRIDEADARLWSDKAHQFAASASQPIVALVDATEATYITAAARQVFARATKIPNLQMGVIASANFLVQQNAHLITLMSPNRHTRIFDSFDDAQRFAREQAQRLRDNSARA